MEGSSPREMASAGLSPEFTCFQGMDSESLCISETLFPTNVESFLESVEIQAKVMVESDQKVTKEVDILKLFLIFSYNLTNKRAAQNSLGMDIIFKGATLDLAHNNCT